MAQHSTYKIGMAGQAWNTTERAHWLASQIRQRSYHDDVTSRIASLRNSFEIVQYGQIEAASELYPLRVLKSRVWKSGAPCALITGGVHGYETSGVHGALQFLEREAARYEERFNLLVAPCVSPWAYERVQRWNHHAVDPNRSFRLGGTAEESLALMRFIAPFNERIVVHMDLHETTDSDESEFRPAAAARDGKPFSPGTIPDGFYVVGNSVNPQPEFQRAIITAVAKVTHIAPADSNNRLIGLPMVSPGVVLLPFKSVGLCAGMTDAELTATTEVYPDSQNTTPSLCNDAQVAAVCSALDFCLASQLH